MDRLNKEYMEILSQEGKNLSDIFRELEDRIKQDKKLTGLFVPNVRRAAMEIHVISLLRESAITLDFQSESKNFKSR